MALNQTQKDNLYKGLGLFLEAMRPYAVSVLMKEAGEKWPVWFVEALNAQQQENWKIGLRQGTDPEALIDFHYLKPFALKYKELLRKDFGSKDMHNVPTWFGEIADVRHQIAHFREVEEDQATNTWIKMIQIARALSMDELVAELTKLREARPEPVSASAKLAGPQPWFQVVAPHLDIRQGRLDESVFAANLAEVALGNGREIYNNPAVFFSKTSFTAGLKTVARRVIKGLNGEEDAENRVISLQTGFGGGKTHTLISLYHLARWGRNAVQSGDAAALVQYSGVPAFEKANIAVFTNTTNDPANGRTTPEGITIQTIWGELAWQLGGAAAYEIVRKNDEQLIAPAGLFKKVLEQCRPALILVDELADYCVKASARKAGNSSLADQTISFMQELTEAVAGANHCVAVVTLPASPQEVGNTPEAQAILNSLQKRVSRVGADTQPVADDEIYEVIRRRLFENIGDAAAVEAAVSQYMELYQQHWTELPPHTGKSEYRQKMLNSYPFHPELIDVFRIRWASHHDFQRTRGALRLLAAIVSDLWKRQQSLPGSNLLIHTSDVNCANLDPLTGQLKKLYGNGYDAVISADVAGSSSNAFKIDSNKREFGQWYLTQGIAATILLNSFGSDGANKGVGVPELKLNTLRPGGFNHNSVNGALDELESNAYYLYYAQTGGAGKRYWFHTKPNINILINQAKNDIRNDEIEAEILKRINVSTGNLALFGKALVNPSDDIPEQQKPTLIILNPKYTANPDGVNGHTRPLIEKLATQKGNSQRIYRNTLLFLVCSELGIGKLQSDVRDYLACQKISQEYGGQLEREQKDEISRRLQDASRSADSSLVVAYAVVVKHTAKAGLQTLALKQFRDSLDAQINHNLLSALKEEEWLLDSVGYNTLRQHNLLPTPEQSVKARDVYEAFLRFDDKPMISGVQALANSLQRYCSENYFCIASGDGTVFNKYYLGESVPFFDPLAADFWLVDKSLKPAPQPVEPPPGTPPPGNEGQGNSGDNNSGVKEPQPPQPPITEPVKQLQSLTISGKVPLERYTELFNYFITPFAMNGNRIEIEISFKIHGTSGSPLDASKGIVKNAKEAAGQLGLGVKEE
jgi:hypothetical protein